MRNAFAHVGAKQRAMVAAAIRTAFAQEPAAAHQQWRQVAESLRARFPKLAALMHDAADDVLAYMDFRRVATRFDRLDTTFIATLCIASAVACFLKWPNESWP